MLALVGSAFLLASSHSTGGIQDVPLAVTGVDFTGALDQALEKGEIDIAVHSLKDIPPTPRWSLGNDQFSIYCPLRRENPLDTLIGGFPSLEALPTGAKVGTSSVRRQSQVLSIRSDIQIVNIRGNVDARLQALYDGQVDALVLARAGLNRLGRRGVAVHPIPSDVMLPGLCQGIVGAVCRKETAAAQLLKSEHSEAAIAAAAERSFLDTLDAVSPWQGRPPIAGLMELNVQRQRWQFRGFLANPNGSRIMRESASLHLACTKEEAINLGRTAGNVVIDKVGSNFFS